MAELMIISNIVTRSPFKDLFTINPIVLKAIEDDMRNYGYDESAPIVLWDKEKVVIDGHTRLQAASNIGLAEVYVCPGDFGDEKAAMKYAIHNQRDRRNITDGELFKQLEAIDNIKSRGGNRQNNDLNILSKDIDIIEDNILSHIETAKDVGTSPSKVQEFRTIKGSGDEKLMQEVREDKKTIHAASEIVRKRKIKDPILEANKQFEKGQKKLIEAAMEAGIPFIELKQITKAIWKQIEEAQ